MPKPLSHLGREVSYNLNNVGDYVLREREKLARCAMEGIASFSTVESWMLNLFLDLIGGNKSDAATLFMALDSRGAKSNALAPFVQRLPPEQQALYHSIMHLMKQRAAKRDKLAHWVWGASRDLPNALLLADPRVMASADPLTPDYRKILAQNIWVYEAEDFAEIIEGNNELAGYGFKFRWIVQGHPENAEGKLYRELCAEPVLADILRRRAERAQSQKSEGK